MLIDLYQIFDSIQCMWIFAGTIDIYLIIDRTIVITTERLGFCWMPTTHNLGICCLLVCFFISNYLSDIYAEHPVCPIIFYLSTGFHFMESKNCIQWPSLTNYNLQLSARETWYMETFWKKNTYILPKKCILRTFPWYGWRFKHVIQYH